MTGLRFIYRLVGVLLVAFGIFSVILAFGYIIAVKSLNEWFTVNFPVFSQLMAGVIGSFSLGIRPIAGILFGFTCLLMGAGLTGLQSWARTVGIAFCFILGLCLALLTIAVYAYLRNDPLMLAAVPRLVSLMVISLGLIVAIFLAGLGYQLGTSSAVDAFSGFLPQPGPIPPVRCPTCNGELDINAARCPNCDADLEEPTAPLRARLINLASGQSYTVSTRRETRIGRDNPGYEIQIDDPTVSHEHAKIEHVDGRFYLHALQDLNGTYVNDLSKKVRDIQLKNDDIIAFGRVQFRFVIET